MVKTARAHRQPRINVPIANSYVLITESQDEFDQLKSELLDEINPQGALARIYTEDLIAVCWEIRRYQRTKTTLINSHYRDALGIIFNQLTRPPSNVCPRPDDVGDAEVDQDDENVRYAYDPLIAKLLDLGEADFAEQWFSNPDVRAQFRELLARYRLNEGYIEAEVIRLLIRDLDDIDRMLVSFEFRRERLLRSLKDPRPKAERAADNKLPPFNGRGLNGSKR
ncbi:MAG TPA: hypothetical protein VIJ04_25165 [Xanthobacteraceae bacterium]